MADFVVDSSVLVASLIPSDRFHEAGARIVEKILTAKKTACASVIVPVEVFGAIARRTGDKDIAHEAKRQMQKWVRLGFLELVDMDRRRMSAAQEIAVKHQIKGMDAIIVQAAEEKNLPILTFDHELTAKVSPAIKSITPEDL